MACNLITWRIISQRIGFLMEQNLDLTPTSPFVGRGWGEEPEPEEWVVGKEFYVLSLY